jgi:hypothetical protein
MSETVTLHIEHAISDLETWLLAFARFENVRARAGVRAHRVRRPVDDDNYIYVELDFGSVEAAQAFKRFLETTVWASADASPALAGTPVARVLTEVAGSVAGFVPDDFHPPRELLLPELHLVPLGVEHNASDHAAWMSSIAHIRATPGFESWDWPPLGGMSLDANRDDLERHARDFVARAGFTFTVLRPGTAEVIGCLYIYPAQDDEHDAQVRSWVRADVAELDAPMHAAVSRWLADRWPFERVLYAGRPAAADR